jgi:hypothetical protein
VSFEVVIVFWDVTPYSDVLGYRRFGGPCSLHLQGEVKMKDLYLENHTPLKKEAEEEKN